MRSTTAPSPFPLLASIAILLATMAGHPLDLRADEPTDTAHPPPLPASSPPLQENTDGENGPHGESPEETDNGRLTSPSDAVVDDEYTYEAEVHAPIDLPMPEKTPGFALSVDTTETTAQVADVAQLLDRTVGVNTRTLGGLGSYATVSVRGSASNQVVILLDGIPLTGSAFAPADLNFLPPDLLSRIEVYRSGMPVWYGCSPMGSAVNLVTRDLEDLLLSTSGSYGSFDTIKLSALAADRFGEWGGGLAGVTYLSSAGSFLYYDDRGTPYYTGDDRELYRQNNAFDTVNGLLRFRLRPTDNLQIDLQEAVLWRQQGVPGLGQNQSRHASLDGYRSVTRLGVAARAFPGSAVDLFLDLNADLQGSRLIDSEGEIGLGNQDNRSTFQAFSGMPRLVLYLADWFELTAAVELGAEWYRNQPFLSTDSGPAGARRIQFSPSLQGDLALFNRRLVITGGGRLDFSSSSFTGELPYAYASVAPSPTRSDRLTIGQLGIAYRWGIGQATLTSRANGGVFQRLPSFLEMYGNIGSVVGNGGLVPETATGGDIGLSFERPSGLLRLGAELALFAYDYQDLIQFVQNAQQVARPENISSARVWGGEISTRLLLAERVNLSAAYTYTHAEDTSDLSGQAGNQLPGRPRHSFSGQLSGNLADLEIGYTLDLDSGNVLDRANYRIVPDRVFHGLWLRYQPGWLAGWSCTIEARNLLDHRVETVAILPQPPGVQISSLQPVSDFIGSPLPGRTLFATLRWELP
ncbi:MAG: TonB-dependent receptor [Bradymonadales bacterium]|nr:TonB-dependent receptor [Bradymonadales bacterium]